MLLILKIIAIPRRSYNCFVLWIRGKFHLVGWFIRRDVFAASKGVIRLTLLGRVVKTNPVMGNTMPEETLNSPCLVRCQYLLILSEDKLSWTGDCSEL